MLVVDDVATILVEPHWTLEKAADGSLLLAKKSAGPCGTAERTG